jgi:hypothetical protein
MRNDSSGGANPGVPSFAFLIQTVDSSRWVLSRWKKNRQSLAGLIGFFKLTFYIPSYGFRPGRNPHGEIRPDVGIIIKKVFAAEAC